MAQACIEPHQIDIMPPVVLVGLSDFRMTVTMELSASIGDKRKKKKGNKTDFASCITAKSYWYRNDC